LTSSFVVWEPLQSGPIATRIGLRVSLDRPGAGVASRAMSDRFTITLGERTFVCANGRTKSTLNGPDTASGIVAADDLAERGADWSGPAHATIEDHDMMHGVVVKAEPQEDGTVALSLRGATRRVTVW
jgi:hypothetical protein